jgi:hypothetical protein
MDDALASQHAEAGTVKALSLVDAQLQEEASHLNRRNEWKEERVRGFACLTSGHAPVGGVSQCMHVEPVRPRLEALHMCLHLSGT